jgi:cytochrome c-type biogenesis protein CcmH/NrfF
MARLRLALVAATAFLAVLLMTLPALASPLTARGVEAALVCVTTHQRLTEASGPLAMQMDRVVRQEVAEGWSKKRIIDRFVRELGPRVRYRP